MNSNLHTEIKQKYICYIQHSPEYRPFGNFTNIKFSQKHWDMYRMFNVSLINKFVKSFIVINIR